MLISLESLCKSYLKFCCLFCRIRAHTGTMCLANYISAFHGVAFNPLEPLFVAGAHSVEGAGLWDVRKPKK